MSFYFFRACGIPEADPAKQTANISVRPVEENCRETTWVVRP